MTKLKSPFNLFKSIHTEPGFGKNLNLKRSKR